MTDNQPSPEAPQLEAPAPRLSFADVLDRVAHALKGYSSGDVAEMRRKRPDGVMPRAFWLLYLRQVPGYFREPATEERWAVILSALAELGELYDRAAGCGRALAAIRLNERRFLQLVRADGTALPDLMMTLMRYLRSKRVRFNLAPLAWLVLRAGTSDDTKARRDVARDFYTYFNPNE